MNKQLESSKQIFRLFIANNSIWQINNAQYMNNGYVNVQNV